MPLITYEIWKNHLLKFANSVNGEIIFEKMTVYGGNYELFSSTTNII